jgi:AcrR family transcriptional regulator
MAPPMNDKPVQKRAKARAAPQRSPGLRPRRARRVPPPERRQAILDAALNVFAEQGFAAARLDDVARQAGVAKGTLYLYFRDKEELFEQILKSVAGPVMSRVEALAAIESVPANLLLAQILQFLQTEVLDTNRERLLRLLISEGHRFPKIAEFYHREVVNKGREAVRTIAKRGWLRGELPSDALTRFPQLFFAPVMLAVVWNGLFGAFDKLDVAGMLEEHRKLLLQPPSKEAP